MNPKNRLYTVLLVLILVIGHTALALHVSSHAPADLAKCELCTGSANPAHALVSSAPVVFAFDSAAPGAVAYRPVLVFASPRQGFRSRAPPASA